MLLQEVIDKVKAAFPNRKSCSYNPSKHLCYYRHPDGKRRCAFGIFIPDDAYKPEFDDRGDVEYLVGNCLVTLRERWNRISDIKQKDALEVWRKIQNAHDQYASGRTERRGFLRDLDTIVRDYQKKGASKCKTK